VSGPAIGRIGDRATFDALRRAGRTRRRGAVAVRVLPGGDGPPRVAFAVSRRVGSAVVRNRVRRRLREGCRQLAREGALPAGAYLVQVGPAAVECPYAELVCTLRRLVQDAPSPEGARRCAG
jgi:ribonuclease P protein component